MFGDMTDYCYHSAMDDDCIACHKAEINRKAAHIDRLRRMLIDAGAVDALREHDANWFGDGYDQPLPAPAPALLSRSSPVQPSPPSPSYELPVTLSEPILNEQGFYVGFAISHPPGVDCVFPPTTNQCSCGKMDLGIVDG